EVGFDDVSNFNKTFKRIEGISPREYRKQNKML
ncbi:helix-turn-helix domain-containing protein, partial [Lysinibacillus sp. GbtcB16]